MTGSVRPLILASALAAGLAWAPAFALQNAIERLGPPGAPLSPARVSGSGAIGLSKAVIAPSGPIVSTHVILKSHGNGTLLHRTANGYFIPWNGDKDTLADTGFRARNGVVTFKILNEALDGVSFPLTVVLVIRTETEELSGEFTVERRTP